jgi:AcrR family transcriptional regulator
MTPPTPKTPARRADAARNRDRILDAARTAFAEPDADVSMAEISRRAGVGMATLYRNFAGRRELLEALYTDEVDALCAAAGQPGGGTPGAALDAWLRRFFAYFRSKRHVASALLEHTDGGDPVFDGNRARVFAAGGPLLNAAQAAGEVRGDLALDQVLQLVSAVAKIQGDAEHVEPILRTVLDGLRPPAGAPRNQGRPPVG